MAWKEEMERVFSRLKRLKMRQQKKPLKEKAFISCKNNCFSTFAGRKRWSRSLIG